MDDDLIYLFNENASKESFTIRGDTHKYLIKVLRHKVGDTLNLRNKDNIEILYTYEIKELDGRSLTLQLLSQKIDESKSLKKLHLAWCVIDIKSIEKVLPMLNEIGVDKISFIYCDRSQKNFKLDFKRFIRILESSMQQCGRTDFMKFDTYKNLKEFIKEYPDTKVFDFCDNVLKEKAEFETVLIGCEGGFSSDEREFLTSQDNFKLDTKMVLRSESAVVAVASKILF